MLLRYRLSDEARRRMFLEGLTPSRFNTLEIDISALRQSDEREILVRTDRTARREDTGQAVVLTGEYDALTLKELVTELHKPEKR